MISYQTQLLQDFLYCDFHFYQSNMLTQKLYFCFQVGLLGTFYRSAKPLCLYNRPVSYEETPPPNTVILSAGCVVQRVFVGFNIDPFPFPSIKTVACLSQINGSPIKCIPELCHANTQAHKSTLCKSSSRLLVHTSYVAEHSTL